MGYGQNKNIDKFKFLNIIKVYIVIS